MYFHPLIIFVKMDLKAFEPSHMCVCDSNVFELLNSFWFKLYLRLLI
jgi:hypothetical protein